MNTKIFEFVQGNGLVSGWGGRGCSLKQESYIYCFVDDESWCVQLMERSYWINQTKLLNQPKNKKKSPETTNSNLWKCSKRTDFDFAGRKSAKWINLCAIEYKITQREWWHEPQRPEMDLDIVGWVFGCWRRYQRANIRSQDENGTWTHLIVVKSILHHHRHHSPSQDIFHSTHFFALQRVVHHVLVTFSLSIHTGFCSLHRQSKRIHHNHRIAQHLSLQHAHNFYGVAFFRMHDLTKSKFDSHPPMLHHFMNEYSNWTLESNTYTLNQPTIFINAMADILTCLK